MNVMEMVEHIPGFIRYAQTSPQTICVICLPNLSVMLDRVAVEVALHEPSGHLALGVLQDQQTQCICVHV